MGERVLDIPTEVILLMASLVIVVFLVALIALWVKLNKLRKKYTRMMGGMGDMDMETIVARLQDQWEGQAERSHAMEQELQRIRQRMTSMKSNVGVYRYNAFAETGSDLSFSVAILDDSRSGVVLSGIHSRDNTYLYAKPIDSGTSKYVLTPEEKEAITRSLLKG
ncbi:hypothetical protein PM3016_7477 [Paenibacillus mucilaginosus 3016]|uniref:DUF4446 domain-containing protein n=1 Tax=Paenibacillus mucilaginosus 3016 TaxID=1116391 RepID=H6NIZ3_9BACL|nr:DUF4446 family protein [Paenibacillus mucilaginosus]AFC34043.1 hypothetical protein PM3016_7477 [Paenibacillus mucilaginosus 3016]WFA22408.1 DUF4446 family protein [Paenibacillus mucilaginosus]